jgi:hypothetical protein
MTNPLLRQPDRLHVNVATRYVNLGLRSNPFPSEPAVTPDSDDPRLNGEIYCESLHEDKRRRFEELLIRTPNRPSVRSIVFLMDHASRRGRGIGKTAFLNRRRKDISADLGASASADTEIVFAAHIIPKSEPQTRKFWQFGRLVIETLNEQDALLQAVCRLRAKSSMIPEETLAEAGSPEQWPQTIANNEWLRSRLRLQDHDPLISLNTEVYGMLLRARVPDELANAVAYRAHDALKFRREYLDGLTDYWWRRDGGRLVFDGLVKVFMAADFTRGLLLVDEVEKIVFRQNVQERRAFVDALRFYLIDGDSAAALNKFFGLLLTIHPGVQELLLPHWNAAGLDRLAALGEPEAQQYTIYLGPLNPDQAEPLVQTYLDYYRSDEEEAGLLKPFNAESVKEALALTHGVPGPMLNLLHRVIEKAVDEEVAQIDRSFVKSAYDLSKRAEPEAPPGLADLPTSTVDLTEREQT